MNLQEKARLYIGQNGISQVEFGRRIGVSESVISRWLKGSYPNPETVDKKVIDFLDKEEAREIVTEVRDIPFSETNISKKIWNTLEYCRIQKTIGVVYGDAGIGKTRTMNEWCKDKTDVIVVTVTPAFASPKSFLKVLARALKTNKQGSIDDIFMEILDKLQGTDRTIVIDEAQHLTCKTLELVRSINDMEGTAIILIGNELIYNKMQGRQQAEFAQLFSRIGMKIHLLTDYFTERDVSVIFKDVQQDVAKYLLDICKSKYGLRGAIHVYINAKNNEDISIKGITTMSRMMGIGA
mgnify:FL=1